MGLLLVGCARPPEAVREPLPVVAVADASAPAGSEGPVSAPITTPTYGSVLIIVRSAEGEEYTVTCGGEISVSSPEGRKLLKLVR